MTTRMKPPRATLLAIGTLVFLSACPDLRAAVAPGACKIEGYTAECHYDSSGALAFWIFNIATPDGSPRSTAITGYPQLLELQKDAGTTIVRGASVFSKPPFYYTVRELRYEIEKVELYVREEYLLGAEYIDQSLRNEKRISPFVPFPLTRAHFKDWTKRAEIEETTLNDKLQAQFDPWRVKSQTWNEAGYFPPWVNRTYPGSMNLETMRIPLFLSTGELLGAWSAFWLDCWDATPKGRESTGCKADFSDYVRGAAVSKATAQSYPNERLAARARAIAAAIDSARRYHETTLELLPYLDTAKWRAVDIEQDHLEPDGIPPAILARIQAADVELKAALDEVHQRMESR